MSVYLSTNLKEGLGTYWDYSGCIVRDSLTKCHLCQELNCANPEYTKRFCDDIWYLELGTTTRYASATELTSKSCGSTGMTFKNPACLSGSNVIVHLGNPDLSGPDQYLVFDRHHLHRVLYELHWGRNSIRAEPCGAKRGDSSSFRARWNTAPLGGGSPLFHRWLMLTDSPPEKKRVIEHVNDIPLDCREANLKGADNLLSNNQTTHRLVRAFRDGDAFFEASVKRMREDRDQYHRLVEACPPLPDCVFKGKRLTKESGSVKLD